MIPEETQIEGPQEVIGDDQLTEIAEVSEGPTEEAFLEIQKKNNSGEENLQIAEFNRVCSVKSFYYDQ